MLRWRQQDIFWSLKMHHLSSKGCFSSVKGNTPHGQNGPLVCSLKLLITIILLFYFTVNIAMYTSKEWALHCKCFYRQMPSLGLGIQGMSAFFLTGWVHASVQAYSSLHTWNWQWFSRGNLANLALAVHGNVKFYFLCFAKRLKTTSNIPLHPEVGRNTKEWETESR